MTNWMIASGDGNRRYSQDFINGDFMALGPGEFGPFNQNHEEYVQHFRSNKNSLSSLAAFCNDVKKNDLVLLRAGTKPVALGRVDDDKYFWSQAYGDVKGWDLQHCRPVTWHRFAEDSGTKAGADENSPPKAGTFYVFNKAVDKKYAELIEQYKALIPGTSKGRFIGHDATPEQSMTTFAELPSHAMQWVKNTLAERVKFWKYVEAVQPAKGTALKLPNFPSEDEVSHYAVWPFLEQLGWRYECVAINKSHRRRRPDIILYRGKRRPENMVGVVEIKTLLSGLDWASSSQLPSYLEDAHLDAATVRGYVTDGVRWSIFDHVIGDTAEKAKLSGYVDLLRFPKPADHWWIDFNHRNPGDAYRLACSAVQALACPQSPR